MAMSESKLADSLDPVIKTALDKVGADTSTDEAGKGNVLKTLASDLAKAIAEEVVNHIKNNAEFTIITPHTGQDTPGAVVVGAGGGVPGPMTGATTTPAIVNITTGKQAPGSGWIK